jgi:hypothetical protein
MARTISRAANWRRSRWASIIAFAYVPIYRRWRWFSVLVLTYVLFALWWRIFVPTSVINLDDEVPDPAIEFYTKARSADFGGIDRWAYPGLEAGRAAGRLKKRGYECSLPQEPKFGGTPKSGTYAIVCTREVSWPVSRKLQIEATIDYDTGGRLTAARALSIVAGKEGSMRVRWANMLRKNEVIEPAELAVEGLSFGSVDALAQFVADALNRNGWRASCEDQARHPMCGAYARDRRQSGFRPLPGGPLSVPDVASLDRELERIGFAPRFAPPRRDQAMFVRLTDGRMWLDFAGKDLVGRDRTLSVELDSEGGAMVQMLIAQGAASKVMALAGARRQTPQEAMFLVPEAAPQNAAGGDYRKAIWVTVPKNGRPVLLERLSRLLPTLDPAFVPRVLRPVLADTSNPPGAESAPGAALDAIDKLADRLRLLRVARSMPPGQSSRSILQAYRDAPATRAAWALALCEAPDVEPPRIDPACWLNFTSSDPEAVALLRREIAILQPEYRKLEPADPLRLRLRRLSDAFAQP